MSIKNNEYYEWFYLNFDFILFIRGNEYVKKKITVLYTSFIYKADQTGSNY